MNRPIHVAAALFLILILFPRAGCTAQTPFPRGTAVPPSKQWGANTSGPFYTGTAEVEPAHSWYMEPYFFGIQEHRSTSNTFSQKMGMGLGHNLEFDLLVPLIMNSVRDPGGLRRTSASAVGPGDTQLAFKYEFTTDSNTRRFASRPAITLTANFLLHSGNAGHLNPRLGGADQFGNGTYEQGVGVLVRKRFKPFVFYGQMNDMIVDPTRVSAGYGFDNQIKIVSSRGQVRMVDGNLFSYGGALEDVLNTRHGIGALLEVEGEAQSRRSLLFGKATAPSFSFLSMAPEAEFTWPAGRRFAITWGGGVTIPVERRNYPRVIAPMATVTFYFNGPNGSRNSD